MSHSRQKSRNSGSSFSCQPTVLYVTGRYLTWWKVVEGSTRTLQQNRGVHVTDLWRPWVCIFLGKSAKHTIQVCDKEQCRVRTCAGQIQHPTILEHWTQRVRKLIATIAGSVGSGKDRWSTMACLVPRANLHNHGLASLGYRLTHRNNISANMIHMRHDRTTCNDISWALSFTAAFACDDDCLCVIINDRARITTGFSETFAMFSQE